MHGLIGRLAALAGMAFGLAVASPAHASLDDQFPCRSGDHESLLVAISGADGNEAVLQAQPPGGGPAHVHHLRRNPGGSLADFRYDDGQGHVFVGGSGKGVLLMHATAYVCEFPGEPQDKDAAVEQASRVLLTADGLDIVAPGVSLPDGLSFGAGEEQVVAQLTQVLGSPGERDTNDECGAGPMSFRHFGPLGLNFSQGLWVGWSLNGGALGGVPVTLHNGLTVGSRAGEMVSASHYDPQSTLGDEFTVDGISGLSTDRGSDAPIETLWAGTNCHFR